MTLSSKATYIVPFLLFFFAGLTTSICILNYSLDALLLDFDITYYLPLIVATVFFAVAYYFLLTKIIAKDKPIFLKYILFIVPLLVQIIFSLVAGRPFQSVLLLMVSGTLLFFAYQSLVKRYMAVLTDIAIDYKDLLGRTGSIALITITKLEQKKNLLTFIEGFDFLEISKKTCITFMDDQLDEFEIHIYSKAFKNNYMFDTIIHKANSCGNLKIRQYTI